METQTNPEIDVPAATPETVVSTTQMNWRTPQETPLPADALGSMLIMIDRAANNPAVDVIKYKQMTDLVLQLQDRQSEREFNIAMTEAQMGMTAVAVDSNNPQTHSKYASLFALDAALRPIYSKHGISVSYDTGDALPDQVRVIAIVRHNGGYVRNFHIDMPADGKGAKGGDVMTKTHATGSAVTYGRRYLLLMIFNISVDRDDDGNAASSTTISQEQIETIQRGIKDTGADINRFCAYMKVKSIEEIPAKNYTNAIAALKKKQKAKGKK